MIKVVVFLVMSWNNIDISIYGRNGPIEAFYGCRCIGYQVNSFIGYMALFEGLKERC